MKYILYARKSTEEDDRQVLSIEAQLIELEEFAAKEKLEIVASLCEAKTAKEPGRIKFAEMLSLIERGKADGIISWHPDRLARNSVDGGKIIHMVDRGLIKSLKFPTFWCEPTPQGLFMLSIAFGQSKYFVDNLRENVKRGLRQKIRNGVWPGWAPVGYTNNPKTRMVDIDQEKVSRVKKVFELYATGNYTLHSLANWCVEHNLKGNKNNKISISSLQKILQNIFYFGLMKFKGEIFEGHHEPLISKKLFDRVQEVMAKRGKKKDIRKHHFAFLGLLKCASCGCAITVEIQKGHHYYHCTKKKGPCQEKHYLREEVLTEQIKSFLQKVSLSSQDTKKVLAELQKDEERAKVEAKTTVQNLKMELTGIETKLEKLLDAYLSEVISADDYKIRKENLVTKKVELGEKMRDFEQKGLSWLEPAREFILSLNQAAKLIETENKEEMTTFLKTIGSNHVLKNRQFVFAPKIQYELVAERSEANPSNLQFPYWCAGEDSNLHALADTRPSTLRVYQFRHPRVFIRMQNPESIIKNGQTARSFCSFLCCRGRGWRNAQVLHFLADVALGAIADIVKFGAADIGAFYHLDFLDHGGVKGEDALDAVSVADFPDSKHSIDTGTMFYGDHRTLESLRAEFITLLDFLLNANNIPRPRIHSEGL